MPLALEGTPVHNSASSGSTLTTGAFTTSNPSRVIVIVSVNGANGITVSGGGLTWASRVVASGSSRLEEWSADAPSALSAVQFTVTYSQAISFTAVDTFAFSGHDSVSSFDSNASIPVAGATDPISISTSNANDVIYAGFRESATPNPTQGSGFTKISGADYQLVEYQIVSATQSSLSITQTTGAGDANGAVGDAIKAAVAAATDIIWSYFESDVEYFEPTDVTGTDTSATDWYADGPLPANVVQVDQVFQECADNQLEVEDEALYPDYWANAPPIPDDLPQQGIYEDGQYFDPEEEPFGPSSESPLALNQLDPPYNNHVIDPYNYDDQDEPFEFVEQPLSGNFFPDQIWAEDGSNQLEEYLDEPFEFFDGPLSASDTPQQAIVEDGSNQLEEYLDEPFEFLDAQVPANDLPQQSIYEDGQYADPEDEPFDFYDGQVPADFLPDQIWAEDGSNQLEEYLDEPFEFVDGPLPGDVSQVADQLYPELADNQLEDFDEPFEFADGQVPADMVVAGGLKPGETIYGSWDDKYKKYVFIVDGKKMVLTIGELIELLLDAGKTLDDVVISQPPKKNPAILVKSRPTARKKRKLFVEPYKADDSWKVAVAERMVQVAAEQEEELMMILALL